MIRDDNWVHYQGACYYIIAEKDKVFKPEKYGFTELYKTEKYDYEYCIVFDITNDELRVRRLSINSHAKKMPKFLGIFPEIDYKYDIDELECYDFKYVYPCVYDSPDNKFDYTGTILMGINRFSKYIYDGYTPFCYHNDLVCITFEHGNVVKTVSYNDVAEKVRALLNAEVEKEEHKHITLSQKERKEIMRTWELKFFQRKNVENLIKKNLPEEYAAMMWWYKQDNK